MVCVFAGAAHSGLGRKPKLSISSFCVAAAALASSMSTMRALRLPVHQPFHRRLGLKMSTGNQPPPAQSQSQLSSPPSLKTIHLYYNDVFEVPLPENHKFPMQKYRIVRNGLQDEYSSAGADGSVQFSVSPLATPAELETTHCPKYIEWFVTGQLTPQENRKIGFPWSEQHVKRSLSSVGGTVAAMRSVLTPGLNSHCDIACHMAGGTHHAFYNYGEGYCVFSDIAVAANLAMQEFGINRILIVDLDVHQGNGNAVLFQSDPRVFTFSMHCKENYFSRIERSDLDVEIERDGSDDVYLTTLRRWLPHAMALSRPELIFFQAGVDIHADDRLGKLKISREGLQARNRLVVDTAMSSKCKLVVTQGGGYPKDLDPESAPFRNLCEAHRDVYRECIEYTLNANKDQR